VKNQSFVFCNAGTAYGGYDNPKLTYSGYVKMWQGSNKIAILSAAVGLPVSSQEIQNKKSLSVELFFQIRFQTIS
jgi:hypothetical protein